MAWLKFSFVGNGRLVRYQLGFVTDRVPVHGESFGASPQDESVTSRDLTTIICGNGPKMRMPLRSVSLFEIVILFLIILTYIWIIFPLGNQGLTYFGLFFTLGLVSLSSLFHKKTVKAIGLRLDNFFSSLKSVGTFTLVCILVLIIGGIAFGSLEFTWEFVPVFLFYLVWAFLQQYTFQTFFNLRFSEAFEKKTTSVLASSLVFSAVHFPNPFLMPVTLALGFFWFWSYLKNSNLFVLTLSHALLGSVARYTLPSFITYNMKVGTLYMLYR
jgi:membrane protease YdiL (CAAX protease family)